MANIKNLKVNGTTYGIDAHNADNANYAETANTASFATSCDSAAYAENASSANFAINADSSSFFDNEKNIILEGAITGSVKTDFGSANTYITTSAKQIPQGSLRWDGSNFVGGVSPLGAALSEYHSANRLAFLNPAALLVEQSNDGGTTWTTNNMANASKVNLVTLQSSVTLGTTTPATTSKKARITITAQNGTTGYFYTQPRKLLINVSTAGHGMNVLIEVKTGASNASWVTIGKYALSGWSGWNDIPLTTVYTLGGGTTQTSNYWYMRLTFSTTSINSSYSSSLSNIISLRLFGDTCWQRTSNLGELGHLYSFDSDQNAIFPASVTATSFSGSGSSLTSLNASNISSGTVAAARLPAATSSAQGAVKVGSNITVSSGTISLTKANVTSALGYTPPTSNTTYSVATASTAGLVKPVSVITKPTINSATTTSGRYYHVQMSSDGNMFVNVPWSDSNTNYYHTSGSWSGLTYTATANNGAGELKFTIPTGTTSTTVAAGNHTHSAYAQLSGATFTGGVTVTAGQALKFNKINAPTTSGGSTYGAGSSGQVLKSNGTTVYWATDNNTNTTNTAGSTNTTSKIFLVGPTSQTTYAQTYSNSGCYASGGYLYSNGVKVDMSNVGIEWGSF